MDKVSEECFIIFYRTRIVTFLNEGTFIRTSSVHDLPVILKWHNVYSFIKALGIL